VATLGEMLRAVSADYGILGGAVGVGRDVRRIIHAGHAAELSSPIGQGDLVVYTTLDAEVGPRDTHDRPLLTLLSSGVSGVLVDSEPASAVLASANTSNTPLILVRAGPLNQARVEALQQAVTLQNSRLPQLQLTLQRDLLDLARAGATRTMLLERLVEITGKTGLLQGRTVLAGDLRPAVRQGLQATTLRAAINATDGPAQTWIRDTADATVANVLYLEVPSEHLVRLIAPVWIDSWMHAVLSLFARPAELAARDRMALQVAARVIGTIGPETELQLPTDFAPSNAQSVATMAIRSKHHPPDVLAETIRQLLDLRTGGFGLGQEDVRVWLPYRSADKWASQVHDWHTRLSSNLGPVSIGHTFQRCAKRDSVATSIVHAAEAALIGDRLFGPGHVTSYADAQVARLMLERSDASDLGALYERTIGDLAVEDPDRENGLLRTLEVYCETFATARTAERLGVHRNTVLYRLKRIEEVTATDLEDSSTRLILLLGFIADRLLRKVEAHPLDCAGARGSLAHSP
jgi:PucR C-terminal helix-turn-helix domain